MRSVSKGRSWTAVVVLGVVCVAASAQAADRRMPRAAAEPDHATVFAGESVLIDVLANDGALGPDLDIVQTGTPARGTMVVEDNKVRYTPPAGAYGFRDRGGYWVRSSNGASAIGVVTVDVLRPAALVHLHGRVAGIEATCSLRAIAGQAVFHGCVDESGRYELTLQDLAPDVLVRLEVDGRVPGGATSSRLVSLAGTFGELLAQAQDSVVDEGRVPSLAVTPFTTSHSALVTGLNGGELPDNAAALAELHKIVAADHVLNFGGLLWTILKGELALPEGFEDAFELLTKVHQANQLARWNEAPGLIRETLEQLLVEPEFFVPFPADIQGQYVSSTGGSHTAWAVGRWGSENFDFWPGGVGRYTTRLSSVTDAMDWVQGEDGSLELSGIEPWIWVNYPFFVCDTHPVQRQVEVHYSDSVERLVRLVATPQGDTVTLLAWREVLNRDSFPEGCQSNQVTDRYEYRPFLQVARDPALDFGALAALGRVGLVVPTPWGLPRDGVTPEERIGGVLDFQHMIAELPGVASDFTAHVTEDGRLEVHLQALPEAGGEAMELSIRRSRGPRFGAEEWAIESVSGSSVHVAQNGVSVREQNAADMASSGWLTGYWEHGFYVGAEGSAIYAEGESVYWHFPDDAPVSMNQVAVTATGTFPSTRYFYAFEEGVLHATAILHQGTWRPDCPAEAEHCSGLQRIWQPLAVVDVEGRRRAYFIETLSVWNHPAREWDLATPPRVNFIEERGALPVRPLHTPAPSVEPRIRQSR